MRKKREVSVIIRHVEEKSRLKWLVPTICKVFPAFARHSTRTRIKSARYQPQVVLKREWIINMRFETGGRFARLSPMEKKAPPLKGKDGWYTHL